MKPRTWIAPGIAGVVAFVLSLLVVSTGTWSVFDEYTHFDYVVKVGEELSLPPVNDTLGQTAMRVAVCDSAPGFGALAPSCDAQVFDTTMGPYRGQSTATGYLPTYYVITGLAARGLVSLPGDLSWLHASRVVGSLYLAIAVMLLVGIARRLGASSLIAASAAVVMAALPMVLLQFSTVNNDSLAVVFSLAAVYAFLAMRASRMRWRWLVAFALALVAMSVKETALIAVVAVFVLAARDAWLRSSGRGKNIALALIGALVAVVVPYVTRDVVYPAIVGTLQDNGLQNDAIIAAQGTPPINLVFANALRLVMSVFEVPETFLGGAWFGVAASIATLLAFGIPLTMVLRSSSRRQWRSRRLLLAATVVLYPIVFIAGFLLLLRVGGLPLFFQARYLLPVALLALGVAASYVRPAWWRLTVPVAGVYALAVGISAAVAPTWAG